MIKKLFLALAVVLMTTTAIAQTGLTCEDPIRVDENYTGTISGPCEVWYTAYTYDLPLNVHFIPSNANSERSPKVEIDFTCTPGVYADKKLDSLVNLVDDYDVTFPITLFCDYIEKEGKVEWDLSVNKSYREQLAGFGVPYNVQAFIKVTYYESGRITLKPDELFRNCMENSEYINLGDTINVVANDADRVFVFPYVDWKEGDSIRLVWTGSQPVTIYEAVQECSFSPSTTDPYLRTSYTISSDEPKKMYSDEMKVAIDDNIGAGLFYAKIISGESGQLVIEKIPMPSAQGGAILLEYGKTVEVVDSNQLFYFPITWTDAVEFVAPTTYRMEMYAGNDTEFTASMDDTKVLAYYPFFMEENSRKLQLSYPDLKQLISEATDNYIYVRFRCKVPTTITPMVWTPLSCAAQSLLVVSGREIVLPKTNSKNLIFRFRYDDWKGYDITFDWMGTKSVDLYVADTCAFRLQSTAPHVLVYKKIAKRSLYSIFFEDIDLWADSVDTDGFIYARFNTSAEGTLIIISERPEPEPEPDPVSPCVAASTELKSGDQITLNLNSAFTIYRINYAEWVAKDNKLAWSCESPLHTFVAETCEFAVAPYNKYVVNYVVVPSNGEYVLDVATLTQYADKVDADGYLYIRFLTEKEGTLSVTSY